MSEDTVDLDTDVPAAEEETDSPAEVNYLEMSDDDIMNLDFGSLPDADDEGDTDTPAGGEGEDTLDPKSGDDPDEEAPAGEQPEGAAKEGEDAGDGEQGKTEEGEKPEGTPDYAKFYGELTAPLKANGKEYKFESPEDLRRLAQMGLNYNKKMAGMKPHLKTLKLLENNGLLDEEKLAFYIDLEKKNPAAIAKLLKDSNIDPQDLDLDAENDYKAGSYTVSDSEIDLDQVLDELRESSTHYNQILETVSTKWDRASKQVIAETPAVLHVINDHMASGIYDVVTQEIERERALGRLNGLSDIEAYRKVGDALDARGAFNHLVQKDGGNDPAPKREVAPPPKADDSGVKDKKRAARPAKAAAPSKQSTGFNPLALSDEEFEKQFDSQLM